MDLAQLRIEASGRGILTYEAKNYIYQGYEVSDFLKIVTEKLDTIYKEHGYLCENKSNRVLLKLINADVTNNCNLRCPFCFNDFKKSTSDKMSLEMFLSMIRLAPLVENEKFFLSCAFEPFLHQSFLDYLELIPVEFKNKFFFTTNLTCKKFGRVAFERLAKTNLAFINISFDSLQKQLFESLRVHSKFETFINNLQLLIDVFKDTPSAPHLRFTTMALRSNLKELNRLSQFIYSDSGLHRDKVLHEVRMAFKVSFRNKEWEEREILKRAEWEALTNELAQSDYKIRILNQTYEPYYIKFVGGRNNV